ncbi:hypothetical protein EON65_40905 [archaeon]|nr:MAG: hypothetical protein EON65_40905 [archaeon]
MSGRLFNIAKSAYRLSTVAKVTVRPQVMMKSYAAPIMVRSFGTAAAGKAEVGYIYILPK